jgi:Fic family protein
MYIWELPEWPHFRWTGDRLFTALQKAHLKQGRLLGRMERLGFELQAKAELEATAEEALKSSEIEGEILDLASVRSSVARHLGIQDAAAGPEDRRAEGIVEMTLDATRNFAAPLTRERLFAWQSALFPTGRSGLRLVKVGTWRDDSTGPMQVVSGRYDRERVHFQAPPAARIEDEMEAFLTWFNQPPATDGIIHAAIAHLWFVTMHPFDDGNGRIARALAEMSLARTENSPQRFYSLSGQIRRDRAEYYGSLEGTQKGDLDITARILWFTECLSRALDAAEEVCAGVLRKADFWQRHAPSALNERQRQVLNRYLDGFEGKLTARKWAAIAKCSMATAQRDIKELVDEGLLVRNEGGSKNTSYTVTESHISDGARRAELP